MSTLENKFVCEFCNKPFSSKSNLTFHQKNTNYCLNIRHENQSFECIICNQTFSHKRSFHSHLEKCKSTNSIKKIEDLLKKKTELKQKLQDSEKKTIEL